MKAYEIPEAGRTARGTAIVNLLQLAPEEKISAIIPVHVYGTICDYKKIEQIAKKHNLKVKSVEIRVLSSADKNKSNKISNYNKEIAHNQKLKKKKYIGGLHRHLLNRSASTLRRRDTKSIRSLLLTSTSQKAGWSAKTK